MLPRELTTLWIVQVLPWCNMYKSCQAIYFASRTINPYLFESLKSLSYKKKDYSIYLMTKQHHDIVICLSSTNDHTHCLKLSSLPFKTVVLCWSGDRLQVGWNNPALIYDKIFTFLSVTVNRLLFATTLFSSRGSISPRLIFA